MKPILFIFSCATAFFFCACEKDANIKLPEVNSKIVIEGFISPNDTVISITVRRSKPVFKATAYNINNPVVDATVLLSDGINSINLPYKPSKRAYAIPTSLYPVQNGKTYYLSVSTPDGNSVSAETTVPNDTVTMSSLTSVVEEIRDPYFPNDPYYHTRFTIQWQDIPNVKNYYRTIVEDINRSYNFPYDTTIVQTYISFNEQLYDDKEFDGHLKTVFDLSTSYISPSNPVAMEVKLLNCSYEYYQYHKLINAARDASAGNPFAEPTIMYTNINGGLGVFAAYTSTKKRIYR